MIGKRSRAHLFGCVLAISLLLPAIAEEGGRGLGQTKSEPPQTDKPAAWRRGSVTVSPCGKCDGITYPAVLTVYADFNGEGKKQGFLAGKYRADRGELRGVGNDTISSLLVHEGYIARLCQDEGDGRGAGRCQDFAAGQHNVPDELENATSFIWVWKVRTR
jgi:hypothetical protein